MAGTPPLLDGVRVVDLTDGYGALAARLLADLGAEVVRVEQAGGGVGRTRTPRAADGTSLHHAHRNTGKTVVTAGGGAAVEDLLAGAHVAFVSDGAPGTDARSAPALAERHPQLVVVALTPFGLDGPAATWRATELVAQAAAGVVYRSGVPELPPVSAPGSYCEDVGATLAAFAALLALWQQRTTGRGQLVDVSSVLALAQCTEMALPLWSKLGMDQVRNGAGLYPLFECNDGLARLVLPMAPAEWRSLIDWLGSPPEWTGPEWEKAMLGPDERAQIMARLPERFASRSRAEVTEEGDAAGVRITPVLTPAEVLTNEHTVARGTFERRPVAGGEGAFMPGLVSVDGQRATGGPMRPVTTAPRWEPRPAPPTAATTGAAGATLPLAGLRVLEVGSGVAAPEAGRLFGEWGADVVKLESARRPDFQRRVMGGDMNPAFATVARTKRSLAVDLANPSGRALARRLLPHVDVVVENNATGVIDRLGLGWADVHAANPRAVMVSTQLYGNRGPWAHRKGYGPSARAVGGLTWLWAHGPDAPRGVMTIHPDHLAGRVVALSALAGLIARDRTGLGCHVDLAQVEAVSFLLGDLLLAESLQPSAAVPVGNRSPDHAPWNLYRCADDERGAETWLAVCVTGDDAWRALAGVAPELDRPGWATTAGRLADATALDEALAGWLRGRDAAPTEALLQAAGVPAVRALHPRTQAGHEHFLARGYVVGIEQPGSGPLLLEGPAFAAGAMGPPRCTPAPLPGQHTAEILRELLDVGDDELASLVADGAIDPPS